MIHESRHSSYILVMQSENNIFLILLNTNSFDFFVINYFLYYVRIGIIRVYFMSDNMLSVSYEFNPHKNPVKK